MAYDSQLAGKTYLVQTFGCQMNLHDSERVRGVLDASGCLEVADAAEADIVVFMTCCVREGADTRLYGHISEMISTPIPPCGRRLVAVGGCIAQRDGDTIKSHIPNVDVVFGTQSISMLPELLETSFASRRGALQVDVSEHPGFSTDLPSHRELSYSAWVPIMTGCNNFCSYCIVPYVRGREHSRDIEDVICECEHLVADGVRQITLLGQNVNSYGRDTYGEPRFAELLRRVGETGVDRIRFTSSHPKDLNVETISAMAETPAVMPQLHLAVQSGSDRVLRDMNRHYTASRYLDLTRRIRAAVPGIALGTDIIVGFPTETEEDFQDTMDLVREVSFDSAFTFIYSRRSGTPAATMPDVSSREQISKRFDRLKNLVEDLSFESNQRDLGTTAEVLVEGRSKRDKDVMVGHSRKNQTLHFPVPNGVEADALVGHLLDVKVREARSWYLRGVVDGDPR